MPSGIIVETVWEKQKILLLQILSLLGAATLIFFAIRAFLFWENGIGTVDLIIGILVLINLFWFQKTKRLKGATRIIQLLLLVVVSLVGAMEKSAHSGIIFWYYTVPLLAIFLSGEKEGLIWSGVTMLIATAMMMFFYFSDSANEYSTVFIIRFLFTYAVITAMTYVFESIRRQTQEKLVVIENELINKNSELSMLLSSISDVVFSLTTDGELIRIFKPFEGSDFVDLPEEFIGKKYDEVLPKQIVDGLDTGIERIQKYGKQTEFTYSIAESPQKAWFLAKISMMKNASGAPFGYTVVARNITKQKQDEEKKKELEESLFRSEQNAVMGRIAAGIAHEINNPAAAITSDLHTMRHITTRLPEQDGRNDLQEIITRDIRAISRITSIVSAVKGAHRPQKWHFIDIKEEIEMQLTLLSKEYKNRIEIEKIYGDIPAIEVCGSEVGQIILNVVNNAIDAIPDKGKITIKAVDCGENIAVSVNDTGTGISSAELPHIFEPFYTTKDIGKGTGLGLTISSSLAARHGGRLFMDKSDAGQGTTFVLELPKKRSASEKI